MNPESFTARAVVFLMIGVAPIASRASAQYTSAASAPASASVVSTILVIDGQLGFLVLWRDQPGWFAGQQQVTGGGGHEGIVEYQVGYGHLTLSVDTVHHTVSINGKPIPLSPGANVMLVDDVNSTKGPRLAKSLAIDARGMDLDPLLSVAPLVRKSPDAVEFLRCGEALPEDPFLRAHPGTHEGEFAAFRMATTRVCRELGR